MHCFPGVQGNASDESDMADPARRLYVQMATVNALMVLATLVLTGFTLSAWYFLPGVQYIGLTIVAWAMRFAVFSVIRRYFARRNWQSLIAECGGDEQRAYAMLLQDMGYGRIN
ncbi:hypothetical protein AX768_03165 [Burkholderia sp. PAMC 28687]|nr:hypothetical protein AXG89_09530 [Burkholderia sp. PAMC 26561]AMM13261.1 hypothetical protein AX768_03165 [Burkholderia sp. PAMC 28687]